MCVKRGVVLCVFLRLSRERNDNYNDGNNNNNDTNNNDDNELIFNVFCIFFDETILVITYFYDNLFSDWNFGSCGRNKRSLIMSS